MLTMLSELLHDEFNGIAILKSWMGPFQLKRDVNRELARSVECERVVELTVQEEFPARRVSFAVMK